MARVSLPRRVQSPDRLLNDAQDAIHDTLRAVVQHEQLTGARLTNISATTSGVVVSHGLGRTPIGWHVSDLRDSGYVYRSAWDDKTITLKSNAGTVRCDVFVW